MTDYVCTFAATPTNLYPTFEKVSAQPGCCTINGEGSCTTAYGLNNTCHILKYIADGSDAAPYRITILARDAGQLALTENQCLGLVPTIQQKGEYSTGNGMGPNDAGLASKYGYDGCTVGVSLISWYSVLDDKPADNAIDRLEPVNLQHPPSRLGRLLPPYTQVSDR